MSVIKTTITLFSILAVTLSAVVVPALAATEERDPPGGLAVQIFLAFCALIVVAQLLPLARQTLRRLSEKKAKRIQETAKVEN